MNYRQLGRTGLRVSEISLGTVELGLEYGLAAQGEMLRPSEEEAARLLNRALDLGVNLIDTARAYGESEAIVGRALASRRGEFFLCTKVQAVPERMEASIAESLRHLRMDTADLLLLHCAKASEAEDERIRELLLAARDRGQTRFVGASVYGPEAARAAIESGIYDCIQVAWSALDRRLEPLLPLARERGLGLMIRSVLMRGALTHRAGLLPEKLEPIREAVRKLKEIAGERALPELAYRYILSHQGPVTALVGTGRIEELEAGCGYAARGPLDESTLAALRHVTVSDPALLDISRW